MVNVDQNRMEVEVEFGGTGIVWDRRGYIILGVASGSRELESPSSLRLLLAFAEEVDSSR